MTTLITAYQNGTIVGTCDKTCYDATGPRCRCICNGINHGIGLGLALTNTKEINRLMTERIKFRFPHITKLEFFHPKIQLLFHAPRPNPHTLPHEAA